MGARFSAVHGRRKRITALAGLSGHLSNRKTQSVGGNCYRHRIMPVSGQLNRLPGTCGQAFCVSLCVSSRKWTAMPG